MADPVKFASSDAVLKNFIKLCNSKDEITQLLVVLKIFMNCLFPTFSD